MCPVCVTTAALIAAVAAAKGCLASLTSALRRFVKLDRIAVRIVEKNL